MNRSGKTIPSKSGLSNGILRWQQEVCKSQCQIRKGAQIVFHYKTGNGFEPTVAAVPSIFCSPPTPLHLSSSVLFNGVNFPIRFQSHQQPQDPERAWQSNSELLLPASFNHQQSTPCHLKIYNRLGSLFVGIVE